MTAGGHSPGPPTRSPKEAESDLQLVMGGWHEARKSDAEGEIREAFASAGFGGAVQDIWAPHVRTTFMKITLKFPDRNASLTAKRTYQTEILKAIKALQLKSRSLGSEDRNLWITKQRAPEERNKIKVVVATRDFVERYAAATGGHFRNHELDWRGKVYLRNLNVLFHVEGAEPAAEDFHHLNTKGSPTGWFLSARAIETALGIITGHLDTAYDSALTRN